MFKDLSPQEAIHNIIDCIVNSSARLYSCQNIKQLKQSVQQTIHELDIDGFYRLDLNQKVDIEFFQNGRLLPQTTYPPNITWHQQKTQVVEQEKALIFKLPYIQFNIRKTTSIMQHTSLYKSVILIWLQQVNGWCGQFDDRQSLLRQHANKQHTLKQSLENINNQLAQKLSAFNHQKMKVSESFVRNSIIDIEQDDNQVQTLITSLQDQAQAIVELSHHQEELKQCIVDLMKSVNDYLE